VKLPELEPVTEKLTRGAAPQTRFTGLEVPTDDNETDTGIPIVFP